MEEVSALNLGGQIKDFKRVFLKLPSPRISRIPFAASFLKGARFWGCVRARAGGGKARERGHRSPE